MKEEKICKKVVEFKKGIVYNKIKLEKAKLNNRQN